MLKLMLKSQKGLAPLILIVIVAIVGAMAIGGYFLTKKSGSPIGVPGVSQTTQATEKDFSFIDDEKVRKHFAAQANQQTYRQKSTTSAKKGSSVNEYQIKSDLINIRTIENGSKGETSHLITIGEKDGETIYVKDYSDNKWWREVVKNASPSPTVQEETKNVTQEYQQKAISTL